MRLIAKILVAVTALSATALPQAADDTAAVSPTSAVSAVRRDVATDLRTVTDADFQKVVLESKKPVAVLFYAPWCGPCKMLTPNVESLAQQHPELLAVKLNVDENPVTPVEYSVAALPMILVFQEGKVVKSILGARSEARLESDLAPFLGVLPGAGVAVAVGSGPRDVALTQDGRHAYVANSDANTVSVIDTTTNQVTDTITVGGSPRDVALTQDG
ncbi:thioredoxin domain-containing protein, partial [Streptomyces sp. NPDC054783]